jgi:thioredoxin 1
VFRLYACGRRGAVYDAGYSPCVGVSEVTDDTFEQEVIQADLPVVVDFWAPWCGPCRVVNPIIEDLASQHGERVKFVKLNVDDNPGTSTRYNVLSIPTVILFERGQAQETVIGARSKSHYESAWERWLTAAA